MIIYTQLTRPMNTFKTILLTAGLLLCLNLASFAQQGGQFRVLVFSKTTGFRHQFASTTMAIMELLQRTTHGLTALPSILSMLDTISTTKARTPKPSWIQSIIIG